MADKRLIDIFLELVRIDGVSGNERNVADYIISFLKNLNLKPYEDDSNNLTSGNSGNVICEIGTGGDFA
jgi:tripeptide aminopeptidase